MNPRPESTSSLEFLHRAHRHAARTALVSAGTASTYAELLDASASGARRLHARRADGIAGERVGLLAAPGIAYVVGLWSIWRTGAIAVPIKPGLPDAEIDHILRDAQPIVVLTDETTTDDDDAAAERLDVETIPIPALVAAPDDERRGDVPIVDGGAPALMIYTSGTTGKPKGVVHSHDSLAAQMDGLVAAWGWERDDIALLVLPLNHIHGIVNVLGCALWSGACCRILPRFDVEQTWDELTSPFGITVFMAVPTIYQRLIDAWRSADPQTRAEMTAALGRLRLTVSGSAALAVPTLEQWHEIGGGELLERYGMSETGMILSNVRGASVPGHVGEPLPGVDIRLVDENHDDIEHDDTPGEGQPGEVLVRSAQLFTRYWNAPEATRDAFIDGWFATGDLVQPTPHGHRHLGRLSQDIIKTGGEKVSAIEIEAVLRDHPAIADCAVVATHSADWGETVSAAIVLDADPDAATVPDADTLSLDDVRAWCKRFLAAHKAPRRLAIVDELPRNAMGKTIKTEVRELFADHG